MPARTTPPTLPPLIWHLADLYNTYIFPRLPEALQSLSETLAPFLTSVISASSNGDIVSLAAFLLTVYLTLRIADYVRRSVVAWVIFMAKIALVMAVIEAVFYVNRYGLTKALDDAEWVVSTLWGLVEDRIVNGGGGGTDNRTGWYGNSGGRGGENSWNVYGGGRQPVPVGRGGSGRKRAGGWT
ncbi:uncharacterized protein Z518_03089 [Rhinocladiella mackenziei CBS 650.93]|uniref:Uncharacterized protein n=1 Tax=Rhinocladiella mackenziei CBS 650.93 TaxID=1442369 RepID=A0A0D2HD78_9EURO|nr:uncharacterized protein Z518_03089 [Rhinocladiella mackenziei CBS 650.93]KIX08433.1 hypothetical protein Z518_03089 [Rhinocladiella mackenziei CBS 650.93]